jgi:NAD(P)-dependent dehydrogenase (short-subunit alcohol dehydrogenase family)
MANAHVTQIALVTGGTSGIGLETVRLLARRGQHSIVIGEFPTMELQVTRRQQPAAHFANPVFCSLS